MENGGEIAMKKRLVSVLLVLCVLLTLVPSAAFAAAEDGAGTADSSGVYSIQSISLTAAANTAAVRLTATGDCTLCVALYAGSGQMLDVKQYAVTGKAEEQRLTSSLPTNMPEDFTLKAFLLDSGSRPLCAAFSADSGTIDTESYSVTALVVDDGNTSVTATVSTEAACVIRLVVTSANGSETLFQEIADADAALEMAEISIPLENGTLPEEFRLTAQLVTGSGDPLSNPYTTLAYTKAYQASVSKTPQDFPAAQVLDFGGDGFAVLAEGVEKVGGTAVESDGRYTFPASAVPAVGDTLLLTLENGMPVPVRVGAVTVNGVGTCTVTPDANVTVSDFYRYLNISASASAVQVSADPEGVSLAGADASPTIDTGLEVGPVSITLTGGFELKGSVYFDLDMDPSYIEVYGLIHGEGNVDVTVQGAYDSGDNSDPLEISLYISPYIPLGATNIFWQFDVTWPVTFKFEGGGSLSSNFTIDCGIRYDSVNQVQKIWKKTSTAGVKLEAAFSISTGPKFSANLCMAGVPLSLSLGARIPLALTGTGKLLEQSQDKVHACNVCLDILLALEPEITGSLEFSITYDLSITPLKITIIKGTFPIKRWYISVKNPEDSLFQGKLTEGAGFCPNYSYRVDFTALDREGSELTGQEIEVLKDSETVGTVPSGSHLFLYNGNYTARMTTVPGRSYESKFTVSGETAAVTVKEKTTITELHVTDEDTGKSLAGVNVTYTDNVIDHSYSGYATHEDGSCVFQLLPGMHTFVVSMDGYQGNARAVTVGSDKLSVDMTMKRKEPYAKLTVHVENQDGEALEMPIGVTQNGTYVTGAFGSEATFTLDDGTYTVTANPLTTDYTSTSAEVTLTAGDETEITLVLNKNDALLSGVVTDAEDGSPLSDAAITAWQDGKEISTAASEADGSYELGLPSGSYTITASKSGYGNSSVQLTVDPGETTRDFHLEAQASGWSLVNGVLTIWGSGPMDTYSTVNRPPWESVSSAVRSVVIQPGITSVGYYAFYNYSNLTSVSIPDTVTSIGAGAFQSTGLTSVTIPGSVASIQTYAFSDCKALTSVNICEGVPVIGEKMFEYCTALTGITIPKSVNTIYSGAFLHSGLTSITIPNTVTSIGARAFEGCAELTSASVSGSVASFGGSVFRDCTKLTDVTLGSGLTGVGESMFSGCTSLTSITLPTSITSIGAYAFCNCLSLDHITIPGNVTAIGDGAFQYCRNLTSANIIGSVTTIGPKTFQYCNALETVVIPSSVTSFGDFSFDCCNALRSIRIPDGATSIGSYAFQDCYGLTSVTIPASMEFIASVAFRNCTGLTDIYYGGTEERWAAVCYQPFGDSVTIHYNSVT